MTVTEVKQALGSWSLRLKADTPKSILDALTPLGHIAIVPGRVNPEQYGDNLLLAARYVGVYRGKSSQDDYEIRGCGMAYWLGDEEDKGDVFESPVVLNAASFAASVTALLPPGGAVTAGTIHSVAGTYTNTHRWWTPRKALSYVTETFGTEWRVNGNGTLDAGLVADLYNVVPKAILIKREDETADLSYVAFPGNMQLDTDVEDFTTRVVLLAEGEGDSIATGEADIPSVPYKDIHGNAAVITRLVSESDTPAGSANSRAQIALNQFTSPRSSVTLSTSAYDVKGDVVVGDYLYVFDPDAGFVEPTNEAYWDGVPINPMALRCVEMTWPVRSGWTIGFRDKNGVWYDLSDYVHPETGDTSIVVGQLSRSLTGLGSEVIGTRPNQSGGGGGGGDSAVPAAPAFTSFTTGIYQGNSEGLTRAVIQAEWTTPLNLDSSTILDGDHYELRYRVSEIVGYSVSWDVLSGYSTIMTEPFNTPAVSSWGPTWDTAAGGPVTDYNVVAGKAKHTPSAVNSSRTSANTSVLAADVRIVGKVSTDQLATGGAINGGFCIRRSTDGNNHLRGTLLFNTDGTVDLRLSRLGGAGNADLSTVPLGLTYVAGQEFWVAVAAISDQVKCMAWADGDTPPDQWQIEVTETSVVGAGSHTAARSNLFTGNTNSGVSILYDDITVVELDPAGGFSWDDLGTWDALISDPVQVDPQWDNVSIGWGTNVFTITELTPGVTYELQIRAVDTASPPHQGPWSPSSFVTTQGDLIAPSAPNQPEVHSGRISIQVIHNLGRASGGTFNLEYDLHHLDVHVGGSESFFCDVTNKVGTIPANAGMLQAQIPAVGSFQIEQVDDIWVKVVAVDTTGNRSGASEAVQASADLIDDAHISNLTVSKITAGTISATWVLAGIIRTANSGERIEMTSDGLKLYNSEGASTVEMRGATGRIDFFEEIPGSGGFKWTDPVLRVGSHVGPNEDVYGMEVRDIAGTTKALIGKLRPNSAFDSNDYGIALVNDAGELTTLQDFVFGPEVATVTTRQSTTSGSFADLATVGPSVTVTIGETGRCMVIIGAFCEAPATAAFAGIDTVEAAIGFAMSGANVAGASSVEAYQVTFRYNNSAGGFIPDIRGAGSRVIFKTGLTPGSTTFTMKYHSVNSYASFFSNRQIAVFPY